MNHGKTSENKSRDWDALDLDSVDLEKNDPAFMYLQTLAPGSRRSQWSAIRVLANILSAGDSIDGVFRWETVSPEDVTQLRQTLIDVYAPATGRRYLSTFRALIEFSYILGRLSVDDRDRLIHNRHLSPIRGSSPPPGRTLDLLEVSKFLDACFREDSPSAARDAAMFSILYCGGLRGREVINLDVADLKIKSGEMRIHGKGRKKRDLVLSESAIETIREWLSIRGRSAGPLFVPFASNGELALDGIVKRRMSYQAVAKAIRRRAESVGLADFTPHDLRRTFVSDLLRDGERLDLVQFVCGHSDPKTTAKYSRRKEKESLRMTRGRELPQINLNERRT